MERTPAARSSELGTRLQVLRCALEAASPSSGLLGRGSQRRPIRQRGRPPAGRACWLSERLKLEDIPGNLGVLCDQI